MKKLQNPRNPRIFLLVASLMFGLVCWGSLGLGMLVSANPSSTAGSRPTPAQGDRLKVAVTMSIAADIVHNVAGDAAEVLAIVDGTENPHTYSGPSPTENDFLQDADILVKFGRQGLEPWFDDTYQALDDPKPTLVTLVESGMDQYDNVTGATNPHVWMDPNLVKRMAKTVYDALAAEDAANQAAYFTNLGTYNATLDALLTRIAGNRTIFEGTKVVVHHASFKYLFDLLGIQRLAAIEEREGEEPSVQHINQVVDTMQAQNCTLIINQPQLDEGDVLEIARETNAQIADLTPLLGVPDENGDPILTYVDMIDYNLRALANPHDPPPPVGDIPGASSLVLLAMMAVGIGLVAGRVIAAARRRRH